MSSRKPLVSLLLQEDLNHFQDDFSDFTQDPYPESQKLRLSPDLEKLDSKYRVIEERSERLLKRSKGIKQASPGHHPGIKQASSRHHSRSDVSYMTLLCMSKKKASRRLLELVKERASMMEGRWVSIIYSEEAIEVVGKNAAYTKLLIYRLEEQGWFKIEKSWIGGRALLISPDHYGLISPV